MDTKQDRVEMLHDAISFRTPKRIPMYGNNGTWNLIDDGISFVDALHDWNVMFESHCTHFERYNFDFYKGPGGRNPIRVVEAMDACDYDITADTINATDRISIAPEDYDEYLKDPKKYVWEKSFAMRVRNIDSPDVWERTRKAAIELMAFREYLVRIDKAMTEGYQLPREAKYSVDITSGFCYVMNFYRGIKQVSIDLRRNYEKVKEHIAYMEAGKLDKVEAACKDETPNDTAAFDFSGGMLEHSILSVKQFEDLVWPHYGKFFKIIEKYNKTAFIKTQAEILRFSDFLSEIKKGTAAYQIEMDDAYEIRKRIPNICIVGGLPVIFLNHRTPQECVSKTKQVIDDLGAEGGLILSPAKSPCYRGDCTRENMLAFSEFVRSYKLR